MFRIRFVAVAAVVSITAAGVIPSVAAAQSSGTAASSPRQVQKAQRTAARKSNRAQKNAELSTLKTNGYDPAGDQTNYPQNIQNAEKKSAAAKASSTP
jgi:type II secretory pathway pseudopilin PulG